MQSIQDLQERLNGPLAKIDDLDNGWRIQIPQYVPFFKSYSWIYQTTAWNLTGPIGLSKLLVRMAWHMIELLNCIFMM